MLNKLKRKKQIKRIFKIIFDDFPFLMLMLGITKAGVAKNMNAIIKIDGDNIEIVLTKKVNINVIFAASGLIENKQIELKSSTTMKKPKKPPMYCG